MRPSGYCWPVQQPSSVSAHARPCSTTLRYSGSVPAAFPRTHPKPRRREKEQNGDLLATALHRLRKLLGQPEAIQVQEGRLTLHARRVWVDPWLPGPSSGWSARRAVVQEVARKCVRNYKLNS